MKFKAIALLFLMISAGQAAADDSDPVLSTVDARMAALPAVELQALLPVRNNLSTLREESINFGTAAHGFSFEPDCIGEADLPAIFNDARRMASISALLTETQAEWLSATPAQRDLLAATQAGIAADIMLSPHVWIEEELAERYRTAFIANAPIEWSTPSLQAWATLANQNCMTLEIVMKLLLEASASHRISGWETLTPTERRQMVRALTTGLYAISE